MIEKEYHNWDAFVVLHGTDTMAYTSSALSFMLQNLAKTVRTRVHTADCSVQRNVHTEYRLEHALSFMLQNLHQHFAKLHTET